MPTYEYVCDSCGHAFEQFQSIKDKPLKACPKCGKKTVQRLIGTGAALLFKGSGFYHTDYRSESYKKAAAAESKPADAAKPADTGAAKQVSTQDSPSKPAQPPPDNRNARKPKKPPPTEPRP